MSLNYNDVLFFWFEQIDSSYWFKKDEHFDAQVRARFLNFYKAICRGETAHWRATPEGRLAEIIVLDQFSRNMFRGTAQSFEGDELALKLAKEAVAAGDDKKLPVQQRGFLYMPYMHSEDKAVHEEAVKLFNQPGLENNLKFEYLHKKIIDRFGRYPHRNEVLGRESTKEELEFLKTAGSSF
jgi:uncharacterized protein (DUF924 family)